MWITEKKFWCDGCTDNSRGFLDLKSMKKHVHSCHRLYIICPRPSCSMVYPRSQKTSHLHEKRYFRKNGSNRCVTVTDAENGSVSEKSNSEAEVDSIPEEPAIQEVYQNEGAEKEESLIDVLPASETENDEVNLSSVVPSAEICTAELPHTNSDSNNSEEDFLSDVPEVTSEEDSNGSSLLQALITTSVAALTAISIRGLRLFNR